MFLSKREFDNKSSRNDANDAEEMLSIEFRNEFEETGTAC